MTDRTVRRSRRPLDSPVAAQILREYYEQARTVRGWTPLDSPARAASVALSDLLAELWEDEGVSCDSLDEAMGARPGTARKRMARHGYRPISPSMATARYRGVLPPHAKGRAAVNRVDLAGQRFHDLTAVRPTGETSPQGVLWLFTCKCGGERVAAAGQVKAGKVRSCGCRRSGPKPRRAG